MLQNIQILTHLWLTHGITRSDALSSVGSLIGILGARLGYAILDPIASVVICGCILKAALDIFRESINKMVDHSCDNTTETKDSGTCTSTARG